MIAAAFIGPGTLTTASAAGAAENYSLIWALFFATFACIVVQEASARISIVNDKDLPEVLTKVYSGASSFPLRLFLGGSVIFGCAAYQAGNILGAISGIELVVGIPVKLAIAILVIIVAILLYLGTYKSFATLLSILVGIMGISFLIIAFNSDLDPIGILNGFIPSFPEGSEWLILGLVGTTIVPYNLFLGSGISKGQTIPIMRIGLIVSVGLGGIISIAILISGTLINGEFSFLALATAMSNILGEWAIYLLAFGLFAAGFTSSITAPLAAAFISRGFFGQKNRKKAYHMGWILVLGSGFIIGMLGFKPVPVIILAQALNGLILPVIAVFLMIMVNDPRVLPTHQNNLIQNILFSIILFVVLSIGINNLLSAASNIISIENYKMPIILGFSTLVTTATLFKITKIRKI